MKHTLKRVLAMGTALVLTLGLSTAALAAEGEELPVSPAPAAEQTIAVQLDGQNLTFTDAVPQVKDQRTFLPFRAVFEVWAPRCPTRATSSPPPGTARP